MDLRTLEDDDLVAILREHVDDDHRAALDELVVRLQGLRALGFQALAAALEMIGHPAADRLFQESTPADPASTHRAKEVESGNRQNPEAS